MRAIYLVILSVSIFLSACRKETKEIVTEQPSVSVDVANPCYGNTWTLAGEFNPGVNVLHLT